MKVCPSKFKGYRWVLDEQTKKWKKQPIPLQQGELFVKEKKDDTKA